MSELTEWKNAEIVEAEEAVRRIREFFASRDEEQLRRVRVTEDSDGKSTVGLAVGTEVVSAFRMESAELHQLSPALDKMASRRDRGISAEIYVGNWISMGESQIDVALRDFFRFNFNGDS